MVIGDRPSPCFVPATPAVSRGPAAPPAPVRASYGGTQRPQAAPARSQGISRLPADIVEMPDAEAASSARSHSMLPKTQFSTSPVRQRDSSMAAALEPQPMQLEGAFAAAAAGSYVADEEEQKLCVMRPVVNLPFSGKTPQSVAALAVVKSTQTRQSFAGTRAQAAAQRSALRRHSKGRAVVSIAELSRMAVEDAAHMEALPRRTPRCWTACAQSWTIR